MEYLQVNLLTKGCNFMSSCSSGDMVYIKDCINSFQCLLKNENDDNCITLAAKNKREDVLEFLIETKKFDIRNINKDNKDLLDYVLEFELINIFEKYKHVFKLFDKSRYKYIYNKSEQYVRMFHELGLKFPENVLIKEIENLDKDKVLMRNNITSDPFKLTLENTEGLNCDYPNIIATLLELGIRSQEGEYPLTLASKKGYANIVKLLINHGYDCNIAYCDEIFYRKLSCTPLMKAIQSNSLETVKILVESGANVNYQREDGMTILMLSCSQYNKVNEEIIKFLVEAGADCNFRNINGENVLSTFSNLSDSMMKILIENTKDPNFFNGYHTFFMLASSFGRYEIVKMLIKRKVDINFRNGDGNSALTYALKNKHSSIVKLLEKNGAKRTFVESIFY